VAAFKKPVARPMSWVDAMIRLTRLSNQPVLINADVIAYVEANPDTLVTLTNGERIHIRETVEQVVDLAVGYHQRVRDPRGWSDASSRTEAETK
jgi:flagellar protein FlbD